MDLLEYQGKQFFASYGIPVSDGEATGDVDAAVAIADRVGYPVVVKAQVHTGDSLAGANPMDSGRNPDR